MTPFWCTSSHLFLQQRGYLKHRRRILTKKQSDSELGERRKSYLSAVGQSRLHFVLECWGMIALDSKWRGIDVIWDFSTIRNNDLFSEATNCQVITCLGGENGQSFGTGSPGVLSIVREEVSLEMLGPPLRQRPGSACFHRPHDPPGQTTASFSAPLLTSLSLCEGKVQSCILLNGKWCINSERDGPLQLQHRPTDELRHRCLFLGTVRRGNMVGKGRLEYSPCSICLPMPLSYCHLH